ncbi:hypothetical protein NDU88_004589 [Pleurodeles waltl]|uniref:Uncharacterized protein n=1 Tax=Pleurodeles waltl TaxID=8319 RepID=A0AAV7M881_PLEWA|nr:hypothetical protein NDU88_004589 [Pleurodeles waltl]
MRVKRSQSAVNGHDFSEGQYICFMKINIYENIACEGYYILSIGDEETLGDESIQTLEAVGRSKEKTQCNVLSLTLESPKTRWLEDLVLLGDRVTRVKRRGAP